MITKLSNGGFFSHIIPCPGLGAPGPLDKFPTFDEPVCPILEFADTRDSMRKPRDFYNYVKTLRDPEEAARKWLAFSNLPR